MGWRGFAPAPIGIGGIVGWHLPSSLMIDRTKLGYAVRMFVGAAIAYGFSLLLHAPEAYWSLVTVFVVTQPHAAETFTASRDRVIGTLIGASFGLVAIELRRLGLPTVPLFAAALVPLTLISAVWPNLRISCVTLTIVFLVPAPGFGFTQPLYRIAEIVIGVLASLLVTWIWRSH